MGTLIICKIEGCERRYAAVGFCQMHYKRFRKYGDPMISRPSNNRKCTIGGCDRNHYGLGLCSAHYQQQTYLGYIKPTEIRPRKARIGDLYPQKNGYVFIVVMPDTPGAKRPNSGERRWSMLQHRFVMQEHIGRPLMRNEDVHHINGDRSDNRIENLEIWAMSHPRGQRTEDLIAWAKEILRRYDQPKLAETALVPHLGRIA